MIPITSELSLNEDELTFRFVRASGPRRAERKQSIERGRTAFRCCALAIIA